MSLRYLLDTNIISLLDARRAEKRGHLPSWLVLHGTEMAISAITLTEIQSGILKLRRLGQQARAHELQVMIEAIQRNFADRILPVDDRVAVAVSHMAERIRPVIIGLPDLLIASTAEARGLTVLTGNLRHFVPTGVPAIDPVVTAPGCKEP
jgi:predicted nucleic acid-binding protein